ncbi:DUF2752 domain-containing protein [Streptomyces sp. WAC05374]|uniref:DUF2752 domain-containing protein n=1 Tax=Streptomyces sp. WAC05374 TaxID=2487420 RepID=UPI0010550DDC|nr:DUF2752 domain-containing protein [Streptomyces sp. WAC05374]TDF54970.1 DUF2752 domain-containing protein [Streptomyces sp. WAC05374]TDF55408.1 DUF2752 domain-containing protein [Streptomyces sp. WAC05374]
MTGDNHPVTPEPPPATPAPAPPGPAPSAPGLPPPPVGPPPGPHAGPAGWVAGRAPRSPGRRIAPPLAALAAVAGAFAYVGAVDPNEPGHYPVCPLFRFTGILCPGCGGLRSAHAFIHGDLVTALGANAAAVAGYLVFAVGIVYWLARAARGLPVRITLPPVWWWSAGALLAVFSVVRNLPFGSALAP